MNFSTVAAKLLVPNFTVALLRTYSRAHGHHLKTASYCEISLAELKVIQESIVMGMGRSKLVVLKIILLAKVNCLRTVFY